MEKIIDFWETVGKKVLEVDQELIETVGDEDVDMKRSDSGKIARVIIWRAYDLGIVVEDWRDVYYTSGAPRDDEKRASKFLFYWEKKKTPTPKRPSKSEWRSITRKSRREREERPVPSFSEIFSIPREAEIMILLPKAAFEWCWSPFTAERCWGEEDSSWGDSIRLMIKYCKEFRHDAGCDAEKIYEMDTPEALELKSMVDMYFEKLDKKSTDLPIYLRLMTLQNIIECGFNTGMDDREMTSYRRVPERMDVIRERFNKMLMNI